MLPNKFEMPLDLIVKPSRIFRYYLISLALISSLSFLIPSSLPLILRFILFFVFLLMLSYILKKQNKSKVTSLKLSRDFEWEIDVNSQSCFKVELSGECIVTSFLIWLNFKTTDIKDKKKQFHILLLNDSADVDLIRQLRVRLRFIKTTIKKVDMIPEDKLF